MSSFYSDSSHNKRMKGHSTAPGQYSLLDFTHVPYPHRQLQTKFTQQPPDFITQRRSLADDSGPDPVFFL